MSNTDKAMELAKAVRVAVTKQCVFPSATNVLKCYEADEALRAHIEAMQRDCRTCGNFWEESDKALMRCITTEDCTNHNQWAPVDFVQLTRKELC